MKGEILDKLKTIQESPTVSPKLSPKNKSILSSIINRFSAMISKKKESKPKIRLSEINKEFRDKQSYLKRLEEIPYEFETKETYKAKTPRVVNIIGNISLNKLRYDKDFETAPTQFHKIQDRLEDIFYYENLNKIYNANTIGLRHKTLDKSKEVYKKLHPQSDVEAEIKQWEDMWDFSHSSVRLEEIQELIKKNKKTILKYEPEKLVKNKEIINSFLKLDNNISYAKYIRSMKKLPIGAKAITGLEV